MFRKGLKVLINILKLRKDHNEMIQLKKSFIRVDVCKSLDKYNLVIK